MAEPAEKKKGWNGPEGSRNTKGRPKNDEDVEKKKVSRRTLRDKELMSLARRLRPHVSAAIGEAVKLLHKDGVADTTKLKTVAFLVTEYHKLVEDIYEGEEETEAQEMQPQTDSRPVFSLRVLENPSELQKED